MQEDVTVSVHNIQRQAEAEEIQRIQLSAKGRCHARGNVFYVQYEEQDEEKIVTTLRIEPGKLVMTKKGHLRAQMDFVPGKKTMNEYQTPYGPLPLEIETRNLTVMEETNEICVSLQYRLYSDGMYLSDNELNIKVL